MTTPVLAKELAWHQISPILENEAIMMLLTKKSRYRAEYNQFRKKYNSDFEDFKTKVESSGKEDFEIEDDLMDWEFAANALRSIEEKKRTRKGTGKNASLSRSI